MSVSVNVCMCVCARARVRVNVCVRACVRARVLKHISAISNFDLRSLSAVVKYVRTFSECLVSSQLPSDLGNLFLVHTDISSSLRNPLLPLTHSLPQ